MAIMNLVSHPQIYGDKQHNRDYPKSSASRTEFVLLFGCVKSHRTVSKLDMPIDTLEGNAPNSMTYTMLTAQGPAPNS